MTGFSPPLKVLSQLPPETVLEVENNFPGGACPQTPVIIEHYNIPC